MDSLIDPVTRSWNEELVDGLFGVEDAEMIKKIPLSRSVAEEPFIGLIPPLVTIRAGLDTDS